MQKVLKHFLRAWIPEHLFQAIRNKAFEDNKSISATVATILSNYFIYHQQYLKPREQIQQQVEEEEIWNIAREWEEQE